MTIRARNVDKKSGADVALGIPVQWVVLNPAAVTATFDNIVADIIPVEDTWTDLTIAAQPDVPRCLRFNWEDVASTITLVKMAIGGTDFWGNAVSEIMTTSAAGVIDTDYAYRTVTSVRVYAEGTVGASDYVSVGDDTKLGLPVRVGAATDLLRSVYGDIDTSDALAADDGTIDLLYHTYEPENAPATGRDYWWELISTYDSDRIDLG